MWQARRRPSPSGLVQASGDGYKDFPLGNSLLPMDLMKKRFDWIDNETWQPVRPNFSDFKDIKQRLLLTAAH